MEKYARILIMKLKDGINENEYCSRLKGRESWASHKKMCAIRIIEELFNIDADN